MGIKSTSVRYQTGRSFEVFTRSLADVIDLGVKDMG